MISRAVCRAALAVTVAAASHVTVSRAAVLTPFTWDLSKTVPSLGGGPFTADSIFMTTFLRALTPLVGNTPESFIFKINGFKLGATDVTPAGLGSAYGLYLAADVSVTSANVYTKIDIALKADPGNNDGAVSATVSGGVGFANTGPTGAADDITLATGSIVSGSFGIQANGSPGAHFVETFMPAPGEEAAFLSPAGSPLFIEEFLFNTATSRTTGTLPDGTVYTLVNDGISTADILVPEPHSALLLAGGLLCLGLTRRCWG